MRISHQLFGVLWLAAVLGCGESPASAEKQAAGNSAAVKLSQYDKASFCDLAIGADGTLHAVFNEFPAHGKPLYLYYRASTDGGKTWSEAKNLSDDESGNSANFARLVFDGKGRLYCVWKYIDRNEILDGPGGTASGALVYRVLEGGTWSKRVKLGEDKVPVYSWFPALGAAGTLHLIWSQMAKDAVAAQGPYVWYANQVRQAALDGATVGATKDLITPKPILTQQEFDRIKAAGGQPSYDDMRPRRDGLLNLRGYIDAAGVTRFVAEHPGAENQGKQIVYFDGQKLTPLYTYDRFQTYNNFNDPPTLLVDAAGKEHLIRAPEPEKVEKGVVRDYELGNGELGDFVDVLSPATAKGALLNWQAHQLPGGKMAVTATISQKGGYRTDDAELFISFSDGGGKWSAPVQVTNNLADQGSFYKATSAATGVGQSYTNNPLHAVVIVEKGGAPLVLMVNNRSTLTGITSATVTGGGSTVSGISSFRSDDPGVYFVRVPAGK